MEIRYYTGLLNLNFIYKFFLTTHFFSCKLGAACVGNNFMGQRFCWIRKDILCCSRKGKTNTLFLGFCHFNVSKTSISKTKYTKHSQFTMTDLYLHTAVLILGCRWNENQFEMILWKKIGAQNYFHLPWNVPGVIWSPSFGDEVPPVHNQYSLGVPASLCVLGPTKDQQQNEAQFSW